MYQTGVAVKAAKKTMKVSEKRNTERTLLKDWKCPYYHPKFCNKKGHKSCANEKCAITSTSILRKYWMGLVITGPKYRITWNNRNSTKPQ